MADRRLKVCLVFQPFCSDMFNEGKSMVSAAALHVHNELEEHGSTDEEMMSAKLPSA